jgi:hypothetical protein
VPPFGLLVFLDPALACGSISAKGPQRMKATFITPRPEIKDLIHSIGAFELGDAPLRADLKMIVPNGSFKMIIPYRNGVSSRIGTFHYSATENVITLVGAANLPSYGGIDSASNSSTIVVEFKPIGAYRFFGLNFRDLRNRIFPLTDVLGKREAEMQARVAEERELPRKIDLVRSFLLQFLRDSRNGVFEYCVTSIYASNGGVTVSELEERTGYCRRRLNQIFNQNLGRLIS